MSKLEAYLRSYVRYRRWIALVRWSCVAVGFGATWLILCFLLNRYCSISYGFLRSLWIAGGVGMLAILARPVWFLFRRFDSVAVAIEIESWELKFDQRLITVVSQQSESPLRDHLLAEIEPMLSPMDARRLVPLRPLVLPGLFMIGANVINVGLLHHFLQVSR